MQRKTTLTGIRSRVRLVRTALVNVTLVLLFAALYLSLAGGLLPLVGLRNEATANMLATIFVAVAVVPAHRRVTALISKLFPRTWQNSHELLRDIGASLNRTIDIDALRTLLVDDLPERLRLQSATLWILEPPDDHAFISLGHSLDTPGAALMANGATAQRIITIPDYLLISSLTDAEWARPFTAHRVRMAIPLRVGDKLVGIYGCGPPHEGAAYQQRVIDVLLTLAPAIGSALENARAYTTIERLNTQLHELDQLKGEFIENVSHELRTPLTSLSLAMQLLSRQPDMTPALARVTYARVSQLRTLVDRVLTFDERLHTPLADQQVDEDTIELEPLLTTIIASYAPTIQAKELHAVLCVPDRLAARGHEAFLRRALHEIVDNAVRYSQHGTITLAATFEDGLAIISVTDEGPGIPPEEHDQLFAAFYRGRGARSLAETPGVGLGLSIARRDIEALGGRIWLRHSSPNGSTICMAMPGMMIAANKNRSLPHERAAGV